MNFESVSRSPIEERYALEELLMNAVSVGDTKNALEYQRRFRKHHLVPRTDDLVRNSQNMMIILNTLLRKAAQAGGVHPLHIDRLSTQIAIQIESMNTLHDLDAFGLTIVRPGTEQRFLAALPVSAMSGIGRSAEERLRRMRIYTLGELSRAPESTLAAIFGVNGERMRQRALGLEVSEVTSLDEEREVKSVSNERTFAKDLTERGDIEAAIALLGESVGRRLRRQGLTGATVTLKLKYSYGSGRTAQRRLPHPTDDENIFVAVALELLDNIWQEGMHVRLAGIGMSDFNHQGGIQTDLFCEIDDRGAQSSDRRDLSVAIDAVRDKFGDTALSFGRQSRFSSH